MYEGKVRRIDCPTNGKAVSSNAKYLAMAQYNESIIINLVRQMWQK